MQLVLAIEGRQQVVHAGLRSGGVPAQRADLGHAQLLAAHDQLAAVDIGLEHRHRAVVEEGGVVVVGGAAEELDVERPLALRQAQLVDQALALHHADLEVVEGDVVVDVLRALDEPVVGDDLDAAIGGLLQHRRQRRTVDRCDHQHLHLAGDQVLDLRELVGDVVLGVLQVGLVALGLEGLDHVVAIGDPAGRALGRHRDADQALVLGASAAGQQAQRRTADDQHRANERGAPAPTCMKHFCLLNVL